MVYVFIKYKKIIKKGQKYFSCTGAGTIYYPTKWSYGTIEFSTYKGLDINSTDIHFIASNNTTTNSGYILRNTAIERLNLKRTTSNDLFYTDINYMMFQIWYRVRITRSSTGVFTIYIKGGNFTSWTLVSTTNGSGTNPITDNNYTISNYFIIDGKSGDLISNIRFYPYIIS